MTLAGSIGHSGESALPVVCVIGLWHLGTVASACLADLGYSVVGYDQDAARVDALNRGIPPIFEPDLEALVIKGTTSGRLRCTVDLGEAIRGAAYVLIAFDTPVDDQDNVDLSPIWDAARQMAPHLPTDVTVIVSSQVPVGTCEEIAQTVRDTNPASTFGIAYVPENLRLGQAIERFFHPDMLIIGAENDVVRGHVDTLLSVIVAPKRHASLRTAEMTKHAINAYLATSISLGNELANLSDLAGADALQVVEFLRLDGRVSPKAPLSPGLGFGGGTLARDVKALQKLGEASGYETALLHGVWSVNEGQNRIVVARLERHFGSLEQKQIGVLGLTYKPGTSTIRRSAAIEIIRSLAEAGAIVKAHDPQADAAEVEAHLSYFTRCDTPYDAAEGSDAVVLITDWPEYKSLDYESMRDSLAQPVIVDAQNALDAAYLSGLGYHYLGIGRSLAPNGKAPVSASESSRTNQ